jgi:TPR repeat protein
MNNLGVLTKDDSKAAAWYQKAAEAGDPAGMYNLAVRYHEGKGVRQKRNERDPLVP